MAISIGDKSFVEITSPGVDPGRKVKVVSFYAPADTGAISSGHFRVGKKVAMVLDVNYGRNVTASFNGGVITTDNELSLTDTGGLGADGPMDGHVCFAFIPTDTGA